MYAVADPNIAALNAGADIYSPSGGSFTPLAARMNVPRESFAAVLLRDGRVLLVGGRSSSYLASAEIFDPTTGQFTVPTTTTTAANGATQTTTSEMLVGRGNPGAVLLQGGRVLIAGGFNGTYQSIAELFDPGTGIFGITTGVMTNPREGFTMTLLTSGKVLVAGGFNGTWLNAAEIYDPANGSFAAVSGVMTASRRYHTATLLNNGKVLLTGGQSLDSSTSVSTIVSSAEIYDPSANTFSATGSMTTARMNHTATLLPDGKVLVAGGVGSDGNALSSAEIYDATTGKFTATGAMSTARSRHSAAGIPGGKILVAGGLSGQGLASAELFDPARGAFTPVSSSMSAPRFNSPAVILNNGNVLFAGGLNTPRLTFDVNDSVTDNVSTNIVFSADSKTGFVSYPGSGAVVAFSVPTGQILKKISTGGTPAFITPLKDGKTLAVVSVFDNRIFLVGMDTLSVKATYTFANAQFGWGSIISVSADGTRGYISSTGTGEVVKFDVSTGAESARLKGLQTPGQITITPDGNILIVVDTTPSEVDFVDASAMTVKYKFAPHTDTRYSTTYAGTNFTIFNKMVLSPDGISGVIGSQDTNGVTSTLFVLKISTGDILDTQQIGALAGFTALTPDNQHWVVLNQDSISIVPWTDPAATVNVSSVLGNDMGSANIVFSPDSKYAYYVSPAQDFLFQHNLETQGVTGKILVGHNPIVSLDEASSVAITPDGKTIAVLNFIGNTLTLLADQTVLNQTKFVSSGNKFTGLTVVNLSSTPTNLTLTALSDLGTPIVAASSANPNLVNPATIQVGPNAQISVELSQVFNFDINQQNTGQLVMTADQPLVAAFSVLGELHPSFFGAFLSRMDGLSVARQPAHNLIVPEVVNSTGTSVELNIVNPHYNSSAYDITGYGPDGEAVNTKTGNTASANSRTTQQASDLISAKEENKVLIVGGLGCLTSSMTTTSGIVTGVVVTAAGSGYTTPPTVTFSAAPSGGTTATATAILNASGGVGSIVLTSGGSGYTTIPTVTISAPGGTGTQASAVAQINATCPTNTSLNIADSYDGGANSITTTTGALSAAREGHAAVQLQGGKVLVTGGKSGTTIVSSAEVWNPANNAFTATAGSMSVERYRHTATLMNSGVILIAGGQTSASVSDTAELYDPATGAFSLTAGKMTTPRDSHSATRLTDGTVLIAGGIDGNGVVASAELYNPSSSVFSATGSMSVSRSFHTAASFSNGKVLIAGGYNGSYVSAAEIYDPSTGKFTPTASMTQARANHTCTLLNDGTMLITGGTNSGGTLSSAEIYDPSSGVFVATASSMIQARAFHTASLLANGKVVITGGTNGTNSLNTVEVYDPVTQSFTEVTGTMSAARQGHTATFLQSGVNGYFRINSPIGLMLNEIFNEENSGSALLGIDVDRYTAVAALYSPQFAFVQGYRTLLNLINANQDQQAQVTLTLHNPDGSVLGKPVTRTLQQNGQLKDDLANVFGNDPAIQNAVGWLEIQSSVDQVVGTVTFTNTNGTFFAPYELSGQPLNQWVFPLAVQNATFVTAVALLNSNAAASDAQIEVWGPDGTIKGSTSVSLAPRSRIALYLNDLFPGLPPLDVANVRIRATQPLHSFALVHDRSLNFMTTVPPVPFP